VESAGNACTVYVRVIKGKPMTPKEKEAFRERVQRKVAVRNGSASTADLNTEMYLWRERMGKLFHVKPTHPAKEDPVFLHAEGTQADLSRAIPLRKK